MLSRRSIAAYCMLSAVAAGTWWLAETLTPKETAGPRPSRGPVDYYSTNVSRTVMSPEGIAKELLFAETMTHYKNDDRTEMDKPVMTLFKEGRPPWVINSETATTLSGGAEVVMNGDVLILRETKDGGTLEIVTRNVKYIPDRHYAETAEDVIIRAPREETHGTGMQVYFEPDLKFNLLADVRRKHEMR
jgi:lipopolysaccharide export system protein LptC